jgi:hypothetical protein
VAVFVPDCPVATPVVVLMVATAVLLLNHVPPAGVLLSVVVSPTHIVGSPVIVVGSGFTVLVTTNEQVVGNV